MLPNHIAFSLYAFELDIRASTVIGIVAAGGIGFLLQQTITFGRFPQAGMLVIIVVVATIAFDDIAGSIRRRIIDGSEVEAAPEAEIIDDPALAGR